MDAGNTKYDSREDCNAIIETATNTLVAGCKNTTIPNSVTSIGDEAFSGYTGLTSITIPNSVTYIGDYAFEGCTGLTSVTLNNNTIASKTYTSSSSLSSIFGNQVKEYILGDEIQSIGRYAFSGCSYLTSVTIPNSVTSIGESAFYDCTGLTSITIPESVTSIGESAFRGCTGLTSVNITDIAAWCGISFGSTSSNPLCYSKRLYLNGEEVKQLTIPSSVTSIGQYEFSGCTGLTSITIPSSVTSIGASAFANCTGLTSITIPSSVTSIGSSAFSGCTGLTSITACKMEPSEYNCSTAAFYGVPYSSVILYVPAGSASAYRALAPWSNFSNIVETDLTGIQTPTISSSETIVGYYNLQGQRITNPQRGQLVIVRESDGRSRKVVMK